MKILATVFCFAVSSVFTFAASERQHEVSNQVRLKEFSLKKQLMLQGYDVVSYQQASGPKVGSKAHKAEYKSVIYYFVNAANLATFLAESGRYEPLYGGWCAYAMLEGDKAKANPKSFKIVDDRLLVYYDGVWGNTLKLWNDMSEKDAELISKADAARA